MSMFEVILDRLSNNEAVPGRHETGWSGVRGLNLGFVGTGSGARPTSEGARIWGDFYSDDFPDAGFEAVQPQPAQRDLSMFARLSQDEIAADLGLTPGETVAAIRARRRAFARLNHPDRAPMEFREAATARMKTANQLIDEALRKAALEKA